MIDTNWYADPPYGDEAEDSSYRQAHRHKPIRRKGIEVVNNLSCSSMLEIGPKSIPIAEQLCDTYTYRAANDICRSPILSESINQFFHGDFLEVDFGRTFQVVVALEVMEHIRPDLRRKFAQKMILTASKYVIISIPYMWKGTDRTEKHPHDGYNESNVRDWFWPYMPDHSEMVGNYWMGVFEL